MPYTILILGNSNHTAISRVLIMHYSIPIHCTQSCLLRYFVCKVVSRTATLFFSLSFYISLLSHLSFSLSPTPLSFYPSLTPTLSPSLTPWLSSPLLPICAFTLPLTSSLVIAATSASSSSSTQSADWRETHVCAVALCIPFNYS